MAYKLDNFCVWIRAERFGVRITIEASDYFLLPMVETGFGTLPAACRNIIFVPFLGA
jgi:hypothetical protein